jgi:hypothetical protein
MVHWNREWPFLEETILEPLVPLFRVDAFRAF